MRTLTLFRHAKSSWANGDLRDRDRPLDERGEHDAPLMGGRMKSAGIRPSLIVSSPALRAWTTAKIIAGEISYPIEFLQRDPVLYLANLKTLIDFVGRQDTGFKSIMLVGHNPGLTEFANFLIPGLTNNVPTCGVVSVSFESDLWDLHGDVSFSLSTFDYPKNLE